MTRFNSGSIIFYILIFLIIYLVLHFLGLAFMILGGMIRIIFRFWFIFLGLAIGWYLYRKLKRKDSPGYRVEDREDDKTIEIRDYEIH